MPTFRRGSAVQSSGDGSIANAVKARRAVGVAVVATLTATIFGIGSTSDAAASPSPASAAPAVVGAPTLPPKLAEDLTIVGAPNGQYTPAVVYAAEIDAQAIFEGNTSEPVETWATFFTEYLRSAPVSERLYGFLRNEALNNGSAAKREHLQFGLYAGSTAAIKSMLDESTDWRQSFNDLNGFVIKANMLNYLVFDLTFTAGVVQDNKAATVDLYDYVCNKSPLLKKNYYFTSEEYGYLTNFKDQVFATLASLGQNDPSLRPRLKAIMGIDKVPDPHETMIFDAYSVVVQDNGVLSEKQFKMMFDLMQVFPPDYTKTAQIGIRYQYRKMVHGAKSYGAFTIEQEEIGTYTGSQLSDGLSPDEFDVFIAVFTHEYMHQMDNIGGAKWPYLLDQKRRIIKTAGTDPNNYLRVIDEGFYYYSPQEFIASNSNNYYADTRRAFNSAVKRFQETGRTIPMDTFLLLANLMSDGTNTTHGFQYGAGPDAHYTVSKIALEKNAAGFITKVSFGPCDTYEFVLNDVNMVTDIVAPTALSQVPTKSGSCADLDMDNDGIQNVDEGFQSAVLDFGSWGDVTVNNQVSRPQPGAPSTKKVTVSLTGTGPDQRVELKQASSLATRDLSGDGSAIEFSGLYTSAQGAEAEVRFDAAVSDLTFDVTDVNMGTLAGPELLSVRAYHNGREVPISGANLQNLTPAQKRTPMQYNVLSGNGAGPTNTQRVTITQPVDRIVLQTTGSGPQPVSTSISVFNFTWSKDTDGDGIADNYDVDTDNDRCPDAAEGTENIAMAWLDASWMLTGDQDANRVPLLARGGQGVGTSTDPATVTAECKAAATPKTYINIPVAPAVADNPAVKGDAAYVLPQNTDIVVWTQNPDRSASVAIVAPLTLFSDSTTNHVFAAPVDVYVAPSATTTPTPTTVPATTSTTSTTSTTVRPTSPTTVATPTTVSNRVPDTGGNGDLLPIAALFIAGGGCLILATRRRFTLRGARSS